MKIIWTPRSLKTHLNIIDYLNENWTIKEIHKFVLETETTIKQISQNPYMFQAIDEDKAIRKGFVNKIVSLFYRVNSANEEEELLVFWNNRQNPSRLDL